MPLAEEPRSVTETDREIGERIRTRRNELGASQRQVAATVGISYQQYQKYEVGDNRVSAAMLMRIARALSLDAADLLPGANKPVRRARKSDDPQSKQLVAAFHRIASPRERRMVLDLALRLGAGAFGGEPLGAYPR